MTPGPWTSKRIHPHHHKNLITANGGLHVASVWHYEDEMTLEDATDNAALIAEAPTMLNLLVILEQTCADTMGEKTLNSVRCCISRATRGDL